MQLEKERGITIKAKSVRMDYIHSNNTRYIFNLIDTPGHVDFSYEVTRALVACEGAILVIDATQGVEAQTIANALLAKKARLIIIPVINKIDLVNSNISSTCKQIQSELNIDKKPLLISAKKNIGIDTLINSLINDIPPAKIILDTSLLAIIFDSFYDPYRGAVLLIRVFEGIIRKNMKILFSPSHREYKVLEVGYMKLSMVETDILSSGDVGYIVTGIGIKDIHNIKIGETITDVSRNQVKKDLKLHNIHEQSTPFIFASIYSNNMSEYNNLKIALEKLRLSDSSFNYTADKSQALGLGFRCGFLGSLHMEIIQERLEREFNLNIIITFPSVVYKFKYKGNVITIDHPSQIPNNIKIAEILEPYVEIVITTPVKYLGKIIELCHQKRGSQKFMKYVSTISVMLTYNIPLAEIIINFHTVLKSISKGYASFSYKHIGFEYSDLVKLEMLINFTVINELTIIVHRTKVYNVAKIYINKLKEIIPRQMFNIPIQAKANNKIIARENISALRKDVLAKCYGGDISRKRKLLEKQREGKLKMKKFGKVYIPSDTFINLFKISLD
jgi:GTP-binding protein LepA